jgi:hypothetical protein
VRAAGHVALERTNTPLVGVDLQVRQGRTVVLPARSFEHAASRSTVGSGSAPRWSSRGGWRWCRRGR